MAIPDVDGFCILQLSSDTSHLFFCLRASRLLVLAQFEMLINLVVTH